MVGGQALIEGVMMRAPNGVAMAVRRPDGSIVVRSEPYVPIAKRCKWLGVLVLRGAATLVEMLVVGFRALEFSALESSRSAGQASDEKASSSKAELAFSVILGVALAVVLFIVIPNLATHFSALPFAGGDKRLLEEQSPILYNLISGLIRIGIFVAYVWLISRLPEVRRMFQYHGAEHKTVSAYEAGVPLEVAQVRRFSTFHPRCGTTFIAIVLIVAILVFAVFARVLLGIWPSFASLPFAARKAILIVGHILLMPIVAGVCFELLRLGGKFPNNPLMKVFLLPGYWFQRLTTKEPDDTMLEVAIVSLQQAFATAEHPQMLVLGAPALAEQREELAAS
ncbi:MAG: DUF1385 domain-containing protein [Candidatus Sumerlaeaceae bacterium]|nr:DUF1385 domain-containing protein [Candidatus Sumerlaeaceae bacterium]